VAGRHDAREVFCWVVAFDLLSMRARRGRRPRPEIAAPNRVSGPVRAHIAIRGPQSPWGRATSASVIRGLRAAGSRYSPTCCSPCPECLLPARPQGRLASREVTSSGSRICCSASACPGGGKVRRRRPAWRGPRGSSADMAYPAEPFQQQCPALVTLGNDHGRA